ncbi:MAG: (Na+)-NQR maturation NqrM [Porticoccaceae bacterium]
MLLDILITGGITAFVLLLVAGGMAIGVMAGRKPISGSCGGIGAALADPNYTCDFCGGDPNKCEQQESPVDKNDKSLAYEAER